MGINALTLEWLGHLDDKGCFTGLNSVLELGPQDLHANHKNFLTWFRERVAKKSLDVNEMTQYKRIVQQMYWALGLKKYYSIDLTDSRADWLLDLNYPAPNLGQKFDVVVDIGTAEHIFNIGVYFQSIHEMTSEGGLMLHVLPAFGDTDHGFYNIHPTLYFDLAYENDYEIVDFVYVDNAGVRDRLRNNSDLSEPLIFESFPVQIKNDADLDIIDGTVTQQMVLNLLLPETKAMWHDEAPGAILRDICHVAFRKKSNAAFRYPTQGYYRRNTWTIHEVPWDESNN